MRSWMVASVRTKEMAEERRRQPRLRRNRKQFTESLMLNVEQNGRCPNRHWIYQCCLPQPENPCCSAASPSKTNSQKKIDEEIKNKNNVLPVWCEVTLPPHDMVHSQNDIKWQDSDSGASWHIPHHRRPADNAKICLEGHYMYIKEPYHTTGGQLMIPKSGWKGTICILRDHTTPLEASRWCQNLLGGALYVY